MKSLKKLAIEKQAKFIRFFGKIYGTQQDYYIAEAEVEAGEEVAGEGEAPPEQEEKGTGVNKYSYFVTHSSLTQWTRLPDLTLKDIKASRNIKVMFTGDLERPIFTNPFFFGQEKHYLRAQISRITHSTAVFPNGLWRVIKEDEKDTAEIEENTPEEGEIVMPSTADMGNLSMWVHAQKNILFNGRTAHVPPEDDGTEGFDPDAAMERLLNSDPSEPRLKPLSSDKGILMSAGQSVPAWQAKVCGDRTEFTDPKNPKKTICNGVAVVRSTVWPGAFSFYYNAQVYQIYLGHGHKFEPSRQAFPSQPPMMADDVNESKTYAIQEDVNIAPKVEEAKPADEEQAPEDEEEN